MKMKEGITDIIKWEEGIKITDIIKWALLIGTYVNTMVIIRLLIKS